MVLAVQMAIEITQLQLTDKVAHFLVVHVVQVPQVQVVLLTCFPSSWCRSWRRHSRFHSCHVTRMKSRCHARCCQRQMPRQCRKLWSFMVLTIEISQLQ